MLVRKLITLLGIHESPPCQYELDGCLSEPTSYVQDAIIDLYLQKGEKIDEIHVLLTPEARAENWIGENRLFDKLKKYEQEHQLRIVDHDISGKADIEHIWQLFETIIGIMKDEDRIIFDITHSFRYQPILALLSIHFARITKNVQVDGIYYGLYDPKAVIKKFPIVDLTSFVDLQDWITNVYTFTRTGRVDGLADWIREKEKNIRKEERRTTIDLKYIRQLANSWQELASALQTVRSMDLPEAAKQAAASIESVKNVMLRPAFTPLNELLSNVENEIKPIAHDDPVFSGMAAIEWCYQHGFYQQAYTLADELVVTAICLKHNIDIKDINARNEVTYILNAVIKVLQNQNGELDLSDFAKQEIAKDLLDYPELLKLVHTIKDNRNDINHAGWRKQPLSAAALEEQFHQLLETYKERLIHYYSSR